MRSEVRTALAALVATAVLLGSATMALAADGETVDPEPTPSSATPEPTPSPTETSPAPEPTPDPTPDPTPSPTETTPTPDPTPDVPTGAFTVTDAQLRWGVNDESNNRAFAPGTVNFFSAGKIPDPGRGGVVMPQSSWKQADGNVRIEKFLGGAWTPATWAGRTQTSTGATMTGTNGPFSNHEVVVSGGSGTVDPAAGTASIQWTGSFTVIYYSGYSFFYVTDPKLTVSNGIGTLRATLGGFGSSMDDLTAWKAVPDAPDTVLANLGAVDLTAALGFTARPAYAGVSVDVKDQTPQVRTGSSWGSFPQSFIDYQLASGTGSYWYSSGGSADAHKVAKPVTVSYSSSAPVTVTPPSTTGGTTTTVENDAPEAPRDDTVSAPPLTTGLAAATVAAPPLGTPVLTGQQVRPVSTVLGARPATGGSDPSGQSAVWILAGVLLAAALLVAASPRAYTTVRKG